MRIFRGLLLTALGQLALAIAGVLLVRPFCPSIGDGVGIFGTTMALYFAWLAWPLRPAAWKRARR
jgi:hypothetical protein